MDLKYFPQFFRLNYPKVEASIEEINEIGKMFKAYLQKKFEGKEDKLEPIWNIDPMKVIFSIGHQLKVNGYEPALVLHFFNFIEAIKNGQQK